VDARIPETYHWLLVPGQPDPKGSLEWTDLKLQGADALATRAAKKLKNEESLMVNMGGVRLRTELDRVPLWTGDHVSIKQLDEYMARYLYLPRLRDDDVILAAIRDGHCNLPEPASEKLVRDVTENCRTLKFTDYGFEDE
jgi:hypothetical protein